MLAIWGYIEADFRRDYGIRLMDELPRMSWREFTILMNGLNPYGAVASHYDEELKKQRNEEKKDKEHGLADASRFWNMVASVPKRKKD